MALEEVKLVHVLVLALVIMSIAIVIATGVFDRLDTITDPAFIDTIFQNFFGGNTWE
jgi:hypothetical protein